MLRRLIFLIAALFAFQTATGALAASQRWPDGAKPMDPYAVARLYSGKSSSWNKGRNSIYFAPNGEVRMLVDEYLSIGKWYVTAKDTRMCYVIDTYGVKNGKTNRFVKQKKWCYGYLQGPDGTVYEKDWSVGGSPWVRWSRDLRNGEQNKQRYQAMKKQMGL